MKASLMDEITNISDTPTCPDGVRIIEEWSRNLSDRRDAGDVYRKIYKSISKYGINVPSVNRIMNRKNSFARRHCALLPVIFLFVCDPVAMAAARAESSMAEAYQRATKVFDMNLTGAISNGDVAPNWIGDGDEFWYRRDGDRGAEWIVVNSATGQRRAAFDIERLRKAVQEALPAEKLPEELPVTAIDADNVTVTFDATVLRCGKSRSDCRREAALVVPDTLWSADASKGVFVRDHNLWVRFKNGSDPLQLSADGVADYAYGTASSASPDFIPRMRAGVPGPPSGIAWSPDGTRLLSIRTDERAVKPYPFVEWVPQDGSFRPKLWEPRIPLLGDASRAVSEAVLFEISSGRRTIVRLPDGWDLVEPSFAWSKDGRFIYGIGSTRGAKKLALVEIEQSSGNVRLVIEEDTPVWGRTNAFAYMSPNVRILEQSREALWFSERDGWGQIYLFDLVTGRLKRKLTTGQRTVRDLVSVDETRRRMFFTAGGADTDQDPYQVRLYAVSLDGGTETLLTPESALHSVRRAPIGNGAFGSRDTAGISPNGKWLVESYSTLDEPAVSVLRSAADGRAIAKLEVADVSRLMAAGWQKPVRVRTISADGKTPLWGTVYFPPDMQPGRKYPVINAVYGGPQAINAPLAYQDAVTPGNPNARASLAKLGFIVVTIDGRGTPGRSKAFNNASHADFTDPGLADHVAGIQQLAVRFGSLDLDRVGIYGHSFGGYAAARAILTYPDFYKVAVSSAGPHNFQGFYPLEDMFPVPDYGDARTHAPDPTAIPKNYAKLDMLPLARNLKGKLLLIYGDMDQNAFPALTFQFIDALTKANKPYDLMYLPNRNHFFIRDDTYYMVRMWDYFVKNLLGKAPPADFEIKISSQ